MARAAPASPGDDKVTRFEAIYRECYQDLLRFALRRSDRPEAAADVVADTFLIAWRRIYEVPDGQARPWLFGVARKVLANHHRSDRRLVVLAARLRAELRLVETEQASASYEVKSAFRALPESDQELLRLVAWEGLTAEGLATVLDCSVNAVRIRLHRARQRFNQALRESSITSTQEAAI